MQGISPQFSGSFRFNVGNKPGELSEEKMQFAPYAIDKGEIRGAFSNNKTQGELTAKTEQGDDKILAWLSAQGVSQAWKLIPTAKGRSSPDSGPIL